MQQNNKKCIIEPGRPTIEGVQELLTGEGIIELHFSATSELERLRELKTLYQASKKECNKIGQDVYLRKNYQLKTSTVAEFAQYIEKHGLEQKICLTELMNRYADSVTKGLPVPEPAKYDAKAEYKLQSYRILGSAITVFHAACKQQGISASHVLQALLDNYISGKGE